MTKIALEIDRPIVVEPNTLLKQEKEVFKIFNDVLNLFSLAGLNFDYEKLSLTTHRLSPALRPQGGQKALELDSKSIEYRIRGFLGALPHLTRPREELPVDDQGYLSGDLSGLENAPLLDFVKALIKLGPKRSYVWPGSRVGTFPCAITIGKERLHITLFNYEDLTVIKNQLEQGDWPRQNGTTGADEAGGHGRSATSRGRGKSGPETPLPGGHTEAEKSFYGTVEGTAHIVVDRSGKHYLLPANDEKLCIGKYVQGTYSPKSVRECYEAKLSQSDLDNFEG
jgi:hypothetical protein